MLYFESIEKGGNSISDIIEETINPEGVNLDKNLQDAFQESAMKFSAAAIISWYQAESTELKSFTFENIEAFMKGCAGVDLIKIDAYQLYLMPGLNSLEKYGLIKGGKDRLFCITDAFRENYCKGYSVSSASLEEER